MNSVLVGMFDTQQAAEQARTELLGAGFTANAVSMTGGTASSGTLTMSGAKTAAEPHHEGAFARFFDNLFGGGDETDKVERNGYADTYKEAFNRGSYGVTVNTSNDDEVDKAQDILNAAGAVDVDKRSQEWRKEGWKGGAAVTPNGASATTAGTLEAGATRKLQEVEEELKVGKRTVARGGVRIFSRVMEVPVEESVRLREEHANVERRTVDRPATEADFGAFKEGSIEIREMAEEAVVSKTARVTGEVEVGKTSTERDETVRDTVRRTKVDVEQIAVDPKAEG